MKNSSRGDIILKIQELTFACVDMNLYLDCHPEDKCAINTYNSFCNQLDQLKCSYESKYGPLTNFGYGTSHYPWQWVNEPWPWDKEYYDYI